jgi:hypothetical protein
MLHTTKSFGADFSRELVEGVLGLATGAGELTFASAMISSMGKEGLRVSADDEKTNKEIGNVIFICEHLLGMPVVSAIVVYADMKEHTQEVSVGPCFNEHSKTMEIRMHKDTYMFVTPTFIHKYAGDIDNVQHDASYAELISFLRNTITRNPVLDLVVDTTAPDDTVSALTLASNGKPIYRILGNYLGGKAGTLTFGGTSPTATIKVGKWEDEGVTFTVQGAALASATSIELRMPGTKPTDDPDYVTPLIYTVS